MSDALYNIASQACLGPTREDRALIPGSEARPADVLILNWTHGKDTALDVTVVNPLQVALVNQAATTPEQDHSLNPPQREDVQARGGLQEYRHGIYPHACGDNGGLA